MKEKKNIDRLFQEKFKDFEKNPPEYVWENIKKELNKKKRRPMVFPLWFKISGVAAVIAILFFVGRGLFFNDSSNSVVNTRSYNTVRKIDTHKERESKRKSSITQSKNEQSTGNNNTLTSNSQNGNLKNETLPKPSDLSRGREDEKSEVGKDNLIPTTGSNLVNNGADNKNVQSAETQKNSQIKRDIAKDENLKLLAKNQQPQKKTKLTEEEHAAKRHQSDRVYLKEGNRDASAQLVANLKPEDQPQKRDHIDDELKKGKLNAAENFVKNSMDSLQEQKEKDKPSIFDDIAKNEKETADEKQVSKTEKKRLSLRPNIAPVYYSSLSGGSAIDPKFSDNSAQGEVTMAYGIDVSYAVSDRLKVRSGISKVNMNYKTMGIAFTSSTQTHNLKGLSYNSTTQNIAIIKGVKQIINQPEVKATAMAPYTEGKLNQQLSYIEVPFEMEYALLNRRFSISVIGGASTLFLHDDAVQINSRIGVTKLGRANNLNSVSFTTNLGLGFGYQLTKELNFSLEPTFKYQLDGFKGDTGGFQPYYFGVYSGVSLKF